MIELERLRKENAFLKKALNEIIDGWDNEYHTSTYKDAVIVAKKALKVTNDK